MRGVDGRMFIAYVVKKIKRFRGEEQRFYSEWWSLGPGGAKIFRGPREDDGGGVLGVVGNEIDSRVCFHPLPNVET
jgi:hypothetical protein